MLFFTQNLFVSCFLWHYFRLRRNNTLFPGMSFVKLLTKAVDQLVPASSSESSVVFVTFLCPFDVGITRPRLAVVFIWGSSALQRQWHHTNTNKERRWNHKQEFMFAKYDPLKDSRYGNDFMPQETYCKLFGFLENCRNRILISWHGVNRESNTSYIFNKKNNMKQYVCIEKKRSISLK